MFRPKPKLPPEQGRDRRQVQRTGGRPAFSYYSNRVPEQPERRSTARPDPTKAGKSKRLPRSVSQLPFWMLLALATACLIKVLYLSTSPKIVVLGSTSVTQTYQQSTAVYAAAAHKLLAGSLTSHSKLTVNMNGTAAALERQFPEFQAVSMTVPLVSNRPIVYVQLAEPSVILQAGTANYALNKSGVVLAKLHSIASGVPLVADQSGGHPQPGSQYLSSSTIGFMQTIAYQFKAAKLPLNTFVLPASSTYELDVRLDNAPYVIKFNLQGDALVQSGAAIAVVEHLGTGLPSQYLDVRVPERVYYK